MDNVNRPGGNGFAASPPGLPVPENDDSLVLDVGQVICAAIEQDHGAITLATREHQQAIDLQLESCGIDVPAARARRQYLSFDAAEMLQMISLKGVPDAEQFAVVLAAIADPMCLRHERVAVFGEIVALLRAQGRNNSAGELERWWKALIRGRPMLLYCAYPSEALTDAQSAAAFRRTCVEHCRILEAQGLGMQAEFGGPLY
ncbi:MAG: MEDS domain-containing protein [Steroidobacteraceae bacterium]